MKSYFSIFILILCFFAVAGCSDDESSISSGGGGSGLTSDGGVNSAMFAGTYNGTITVTFSGGSIDDTTRTDIAVLLVRTDGTTKLTIDGESVEGVMNGSSFGFSIVIVEKDGLVDCGATVVLVGQISGTIGSGTVSGNGSCKVLLVSTGVGVLGSLSVTKSWSSN